MFWNNYAKSVLRALRDKEGLIWILIFPFILSTYFSLTLSSIDETNMFQPMPFGVVENEEYRADEIFSAALKSVSTDAQEEDKLFLLQGFKNAGEADKQLETGEIEGYIVLSQGEPKLVVKADGLNQTIAKSFLEQYMQRKSSITEILRRNPGALPNIAALFENRSLTEEISLTQRPATDKINYYYALLAMVCMYGGLQGLSVIIFLQPNLSALGARRKLSPAPHMRVLLADLLGTFTIHFACLAAVVAYHLLVLKLDYGGKLGFVLLTCFVGSLVGIFFGAMVGVSGKLKYGAKVAIVITVTMVCCFASGLMVDGVNYTIAQNAPVLAWINPAARITDAFYCLYYYDGYERYFLNIGVLAGMAAVMFGVTVFFVRRQRYESI